MAKLRHAKQALGHLSKCDRKLAKVIARVGPVKIDFDPKESVFEALGTSIVYQQLHGKAAATILGRFVKLFRVKAGGFPSPRQVKNAKPELLRTAGLSAAKASALQDLAAKVLDRTVPERKALAKMSDQEIIDAFVQVKGIGPWTAQMVLIFTLGRADVWPIADYGVRRGYALLQGLKRMPTPKELQKLGERYRPFSSAAAWYCWRATEFEEYKKVKLK